MRTTITARLTPTTHPTLFDSSERRDAGVEDSGAMSEVVVVVEIGEVVVVVVEGIGCIGCIGCIEGIEGKGEAGDGVALWSSRVSASCRSCRHTGGGRSGTLPFAGERMLCSSQLLPMG